MTSIELAMTLHDNILSIIPEMRKTISAQSGVSLDRIINSNSIRGPNISNLDINIGVEVPFCPDETFIVFELLNNDSVDVTNEEEDGTVTNFISVDFKLFIYGNRSFDIAQSLKTKMLASAVNDEMDRLGINIQNVDNIQTNNDFVNKTIVMRSILTLTLGIAIKNIVDSSQEYNYAHDITYLVSK